jgi:hypothetical protein
MTDTYNPLARPEAVVQAQRDAWDGTERRLPENVEMRLAYDVIHRMKPIVMTPKLEALTEAVSPEPHSNGGAIRGLVFAAYIVIAFWVGWAGVCFIIKAVTR